MSEQKRWKSPQACSPSASTMAYAATGTCRGHYRTLEELSEGLGLPWSIQSRTGDTTGSVKAKQRKKYPSCLVTTPESLSLLLSYPETREAFSDLRAVIVDEWHELLSSKRGTQTELCLARLRKWNPQLKTWGLSATLGNLDTALSALVGNHKNSVLINGDLKKKFSGKNDHPQRHGKVSMGWSSGRKAC